MQEFESNYNIPDLSKSREVRDKRMMKLATSEGNWFKVQEDKKTVRIIRSHSNIDTLRLKYPNCSIIPISNPFKIYE